MKKVFLAIFFVMAGILTSCGVSINGEDVGSIKNPIDDSIYFNQCGLRFTFITGLDTQTGYEYWKYVEIDNHEDTTARVWVQNEEGGFPICEEYISRNSSNFRKQIYIDMNEDIIIHIERYDKTTFSWPQCGEDYEYTLN